MRDGWLGPLDEHDPPPGVYGDRERDDWRVWCAYWNRLTVDERREELRTMDAYANDAPYLNGDR